MLARSSAPGLLLQVFQGLGGAQSNFHDLVKGQSLECRLHVLRDLRRLRDRLQEAIKCENAHTRVVRSGPRDEDLDHLVHARRVDPDDGLRGLRPQ